MSCPNLENFSYSSLVYQLQGIIIKYIICKCICSIHSIKYMHVKYILVYLFFTRDKMAI